MKLIQGGNQPRKWRGEDEPIYCPVCGGCVFFRVQMNPRRYKLNWLKRSGSEQLMCVICKEIVA